MACRDAASSGCRRLTRSSLSMIVTRSLQTEAEVDAFCDLAARTFRPKREPVAEARRRKERYRAAPWHRAEQLRGAFLDGELVGGSLIEERVMRFGSTRLRTGCLGAVMVRPAHRGKG